MRHAVKSLLTIGLMLCSLFLSTALAERFVRAFFPVYDPSGRIEIRLNENQMSLGKKNTVSRQWKNTGDYDITVRINGDGFRDAKALGSSAADDFFVVGDSFSFGWGVEENERYSNLLETRLGVRVYNISIPTDINGYERLIRYASERGAPIKNLIVGVCMENDIKDYDQKHAVSNYKRRRPTRLDFWKRWLNGHSALYNWFTSVVKQHEASKKIAERLGWVVDNLDGMKKSIWNEAALDSSARKLSEIVRPYRSWIVLIPSRGLWTGDNQETERRVHEVFVRKLEALHLNEVDLRPVFEKGGNPLQYHFKYDGHWNQKGHRLAAEAIANAVGKP